MKTCTLRVTGELVVEALSDGKRKPVRVERGLPAGARLVEACVDKYTGELLLGFEHDSELPTGALVSPLVIVELERDENLERAARALLAKIDDITTAEFQCGGERSEREELRMLLEARAL